MEITKVTLHGYVVQVIVDHEEGEAGTDFRIRWYGYTVKKNTWEPPHHLPLSLKEGNFARKRPIPPEPQVLRTDQRG